MRLGRGFVPRHVPLTVDRAELTLFTSKLAVVHSVRMTCHIQCRQHLGVESLGSGLEAMAGLV